MLAAYATHYNDLRTHLTLAKDAPLPFSGSMRSVRNRFSADFIIITAGSSFR
jgi:hypothetical protein